MEFVCNAKKAEANLRKYGVDFDEAEAVFREPLGDTIPDQYHSVGEQIRRGSTLALESAMGGGTH